LLLLLLLGLFNPLKSLLTTMYC